MNCLREQLVDGRVPLLVLLQHLRHRKLEILLRDVLPPLPQRVHAFPNGQQIFKKEEEASYPLQYIYPGPLRQSTGPSSPPVLAG